MKTFLIYTLIILSGGAIKSHSIKDSLIEKCCIGRLLFNQHTRGDSLNRKLSVLFFGNRDTDCNIRQINNVPDKNKMVLSEEAHELKKSSINLDSEKNERSLALRNLIINAEEKSAVNRFKSLPVADISQRGIEER